MKKLLSMLIVPAMLVGLTACGSTAESVLAASATAETTQPGTVASAAEAETEPAEETEASAAEETDAEAESSELAGGMTIVNPVTEYHSMDEMNAAAGTNLAQPKDMQVTNEYYSVIDADGGVIAQYEFTWEGNAYTLRCAPAILDEDISGVYIGDGTAFGPELPEELETNGDETCKVARWANIDGQFTLYVADNGALTDDDFAALAEKFSEETNPAVVGSELTDYYAALAGSWQDETSQRAMLEVTAAEDTAAFTVSWSSSAFETSTWEMTVSLSEDGLLYYNDCTETLNTTDEDGNQTSEVVSTDGSGYFSLNSEDGKLYWDGAAEENCAACVFAKQDEAAGFSEAETAFRDVLDTIYGINPGSAGTSLRAEEAAGEVSDFLNAYGADLTAEDYQTMTAQWLSEQTSEIEPPRELLENAMASLKENGGLPESDACTALQDGISAAIEAAAE